MLNCVLLILIQCCLFDQFNNVIGLHHDQTNVIFRSLPVTKAFSGTVNVNTSDVLTIDQASIDLVVDPQIPEELVVSIQVVQCINCAYKSIPQTLSVRQSMNLVVNTNYEYHLRIELSSRATCQSFLDLAEHGRYFIYVQRTSSSENFTLTCPLTVKREPNKIWIPLVVGIVIIVVLFIGCNIGSRYNVVDYLLRQKDRWLKPVASEPTVISYNLQSYTHDGTATGPATTTTMGPSDQIIPKKPTDTSNKSKRLRSLDAFRGFALIAMIFVNYGSGGYAQFEHGPWHGITFADIVFPLFVWMLGTSLVISLKNASDRNTSRRSLLKKTLTRTLKLFAIGFILNTRFKVVLANVRILGVLQRFAIVYGVVASIEIIFLRPKQYVPPARIQIGDNLSPRFRTRMWTLFFDIFNFPFQWLINLALITIWTLIIYLIPFENCPAGYLGPGGLHENGKYINCTGGITGYIDRMIITKVHLFQNPTCKEVYECGIFDPENLFGAIPTMFLAYLGIQAGRILVIYQTDFERLIRLFMWGLVTLVIGIGLTAGTLDEGPMPLNKNIWTLSFSFFTAGLAFGGFSIMYILIDMFKWWDGTPFQYPGMNSILIYMCHAAFATYFPVQWVVDNTHTSRLAMTLWGCIFWIIMSYIFFRKRIFVVL